MFSLAQHDVGSPRCTVDPASRVRLTQNIRTKPAFRSPINGAPPWIGRMSFPLATQPI